ncbi:MAG TPA: hypothetical protein VK102_00865 [Sphingobacterium sp.]|nr:hypothetical protein [Sphingobacterium sp.]
MKNKKKIVTLTFFTTLFAVLTFAACSESNDEVDPPDSNEGCHITLYDGNDFTDDSVVLEGPEEFADLTDLSGTDKDWDDEADSFKAGKNAVAIFWTKPNFEGDSTRYDAGAAEPSVDEPRSIKILCEDK